MLIDGGNACLQPNPWCHMKPLTSPMFLSVGLFLAVVLFAPGAPGPKEKVEALPPPTAEQFQAAENTLKQIALAWHNYESTNGELPSNQLGKDAKPLLSWRVQILPYIEEDKLYKQFKLDEPWDSEHNKKLVEKMPKLYAPIRVKAEAGMTYYQSFTGTNALLKPGKKVRFADILDGTSNTLLVAESAKPVIWTKPGDLPFDGKQLPALGGMFDGKCHVAMCDGSVHRLRKIVDEKVLACLIDPNDGNPIYIDAALDNGNEK
jgi:prepilin-type processing-associated H-X9-DG protein